VAISHTVKRILGNVADASTCPGLFRLSIANNSSRWKLFGFILVVEDILVNQAVCTDDLDVTPRRGRIIDKTDYHQVVAFQAGDLFTVEDLLRPLAVLSTYGKAVEGPIEYLLPGILGTSTTP